MHHLLDTIDFGLLVLDRDARIVMANRWVRERMRSVPEPVGRRLADVWGGSIDPRLLFAVRECLEFGHSLRLSHAFHPVPLPLFRPGDAGDERMRHAVDVIATLPPQGSPEGAHQGNGALQCVLQIRDMSEIARRERLLKDQARQLRIELQRATEVQQELARQSLRFRELARQASVGLFETDAQGQLSYCNERCAQMLHVDALAQLGRHWLNMLPGDDVARLGPRWNAASSAQVRFADELCLGTGGAETWLRIEAGPILDAHRLPAGFIGTVTDVTEFREHARRNEYRANHDTLTGLVNRERFAERVHAAIAEAQRLGQRVAILFLDLNHFKQINDEHGHAVGDTALKAAAQRMRRCLRSDDMVARLGGDEFAALIPNAPEDASLERILGKLSKAIALPLNVGSCCLRIGCSVGMAIYPDHAADPASLLAHADEQMYQRKRQAHAATAAGAAPRLRLVEAAPLR
jgi:diguanylate cyclase (GGDEF)-like protein/PAS domain S-box-containing protein